MVQPVSHRARRLLVLALSIAFVPQLAPAQTTGTDETVAKASFDVISIKPSRPNGVRMIRFTPDGVEGMNANLLILIRAAYGKNGNMPTDDTVSGLPDWAKTQTYDIQGKMSGEDAAAFKALSKDDQDTRRQQMLRSLLEERFQLKIHREQRQVPDYELVVAKGGPKLQPGRVEPDPNAPKERDGKPAMSSSLRMRGPGKVQAQNFGMQQLASYLSQPTAGVGRLVVDKTGLTDKYNFSLDWAPDFSMMKPPAGPMTAPPPPDLTGPSIFTALQEQLGLKLQAGTGTIDAVVVDHVEKPSEN